MPFDQLTYETKTFSVPVFAEWLHGQDLNQTYNYNCPSKCLLAKFGDSIGHKYHPVSVTPPYPLYYPNNKTEAENLEWVAVGGISTFRGALERTEVLLG